MAKRGGGASSKGGVTTAKQKPNYKYLGVLEQQRLLMQSSTWSTALTPAERSGVIDYTGNAFQAINDNEYGLRSSNPDAYSLEYAGRIGSAIDKFTLGDDIKVDRRAGLEYYGNNPAAFIGQTITDGGFASTTVEKINPWSKSNVIQHINVPKGKGRGAYVASISKFKNEREFLLQRNSQFKVTDAK